MIGVIGAGAWGTALALVAARAGQEVRLWARRPELAEAINRDGENRARLPGIRLAPNLTATGRADDLAGAGFWLIATPTQAMRSTLQHSFAALVSPGLRVVITAKGIEHGTNLFLVDVLAEAMPAAEPLVLSGPGFASDVARGLPTAVTLAARSVEIARPVAEALSLPSFRPYLSDDLVGVQIGGALKNVLAIACGIVTGRGLGESARAALIARAFAELSRFGRSLGARPETLAGLSGLGDLVLTCSSAQSRNFALGLAIGKGLSVEGAGAQASGVTEGAYTAGAALALARDKGVDVPIVEAVNEILQGTSTVDAVIERLLQRPLRAES